MDNTYNMDNNYYRYYGCMYNLGYIKYYMDNKWINHG